MFWEQLPDDEIQRRVHDAVSANRCYGRDFVLGVPGSHLDRRIFPELPTLSHFSWLHCVRMNPNHIGCHTSGESEPAFAGTQALEHDVIAICAEQILEAAPGSYDGYVATGGTESNLQALWSFRNKVRDERGLSHDAMAIVCSEDTHYSAWKAADILGLRCVQVPVDEHDRTILESTLR